MTQHVKRILNYSFRVLFICSMYLKLPVIIINIINIHKQKRNNKKPE